ncbi:MAG: TetR/AcrR family transcriptional regulator [Treponema sp.]|nr:TetR/AcrR family transcriptional regulator [Treponema sp.]
MAVIVEHDKRKEEILEKSLNLFCNQGFDDVTFQKIADACGITRTTLYIYFKNKHEIFVWSIKQLTTKIEKQIVQIIKKEALPPDETLRKTLFLIVDKCCEYNKLFAVLLTYLIQLQKQGIDPNERVHRRVLRIVHFLSTIIIRGQNEGVFRMLPVKDVNDMLYATIETAIFRIAVLNQKDVSDVKNIINMAIRGITA